jgi:hypothetical protein
LKGICSNQLLAHSHMAPGDSFPSSGPIWEEVDSQPACEQCRQRVIFEPCRYQKTASFLHGPIKGCFPLRSHPGLAGGVSRPQEQAIVRIDERLLHEGQEGIARLDFFSIQPNVDTTRTQQIRDRDCLHRVSTGVGNENCLSHLSHCSWRA